MKFTLHFPKESGKGGVPGEQRREQEIELGSSAERKVSNRHRMTSYRFQGRESRNGVRITAAKSVSSRNQTQLKVDALIIDIGSRQSKILEQYGDRRCRS